MTLPRRLLPLIAGPLLAASLGVGSVAAQPVDHYTFYDCQGPAPSTFVATKTATPNGVSGASAFHISGSGSLFVVLSFGELGFGIGTSGQATVACQVNTNLGTFTFYGFIVQGS